MKPEGSAVQQIDEVEKKKKKLPDNMKRSVNRELF